MPTHPPRHTTSSPRLPRAAATSACCCSTASRSWTRSGPGRYSPPGPSSTPRTAGASPACRPTARTSLGAKSLVLGAHHSLETAPALDVLIHPGGLGTRRLLRDPDHLSWVRAQRATVPLMASVCTGSLVYAAAGMLTGRRATTHWASLNLLSEIDPTVITDVDARFVDEGDLITSAGVSAGIDMALHLVARLAGTERARAVRRGIQYDPQPPV